MQTSAGLYTESPDRIPTRKDLKMPPTAPEGANPQYQQPQAVKTPASHLQSAGRVPGVVGRKIVYIDRGAILRLFSKNWEKLSSVEIPQLDLPPTAIVESVFIDERRRSYGFVVSDPSFEDVGPCVELPRLEVNWRYVELKKEPPAVNAPWV